MDAMGTLRRWRVGNDCTARLLDSFDLFSECTPKQLRAVAPLFCPIHAECGRVVVPEGRRPDQFIVVASGEAQVTVSGRLVGVIGPGSFAGATAAIEDGIEPATVTVTEPMNLLVVTRVELRSLLEIAPSLRRKLFPRADADGRDGVRAGDGAQDGGRAA